MEKQYFKITYGSAKHGNKKLTLTAQNKLDALIEALKNQTFASELNTKTVYIVIDQGI